MQFQKEHLDTIRFQQNQWSQPKQGSWNPALSQHHQLNKDDYLRNNLYLQKSNLLNSKISNKQEIFPSKTASKNVQRVIQQEEFLNQDSDLNPEYSDQYEEIHPRIIFLRKLYFMIFIHVGLASLFSLFIFSSEQMKKIFQFRILNFILNLIGFIFLNLLVFFLGKIKKAPCFKWPLFALFSILFSLLFGQAITENNGIYALIIILLIQTQIGSLLLFVNLQKYEITFHGASLYLVTSLMIGLHFFIAYTNVRLDTLALIMMGEFVFGFYVIYFTQTILGGVQDDWTQTDYVIESIKIYGNVMKVLLKLTELIKQAFLQQKY